MQERWKPSKCMHDMQSTRNPLYRKKKKSISFLRTQDKSDNASSYSKEKTKLLWSHHEAKQPKHRNTPRENERKEKLR